MKSEASFPNKLIKERTNKKTLFLTGDSVNPAVFLVTLRNCITDCTSRIFSLRTVLVICNTRSYDSGWCSNVSVNPLVYESHLSEIKINLSGISHISNKAVKRDENLHLSFLLSVVPHTVCRSELLPAWFLLRSVLCLTGCHLQFSLFLWNTE